MAIIATNLCYLLGFNALTVNYDLLLTFLDSRPEVLNWMKVLPGQLLIVSQRPVSELTDMLTPHMGGQPFVLAQISGYTTNGIMPASVWDFINNPRSSGKWDSPITSGLAGLFSRLPPPPPPKK